MAWGRGSKMEVSLVSCGDRTGVSRIGRQADVVMLPIGVLCISTKCFTATHDPEPHNYRLTPVLHHRKPHLLLQPYHVMRWLQSDTVMITSDCWQCCTPAGRLSGEARGNELAPIFPLKTSFPYNRFLTSSTQPVTISPVVDLCARAYW